MSFVNFIEFNTDKNIATSILTSPIIQFHKFNGIQLLPNSLNPYIQTTNVSGGIELEDWTAYVVDSCTGIETNITDYFFVDRVFQDTNGQAQFDWSITNVPFDFGNNLVYLKVDQAIGETFYSNFFQFTNIDSEKTCRLDYRNKETDTMQSIQVQMYYWQQLKQTEINSYYEVSTRNTVTTLVKSQKFQSWRTDFLPNFIMIKIDDVFEHKFVYLDLVRANLFEAIEIQELTQEENFKSNVIKISKFDNDVYDPLQVIPLIELNPSITLNSVVTNGISSIYDFSYANFIPTSLVFQRSQDQLNWTSTTLGVTSPQIIPFNGTGLWYFRISHPIAISNVVSLDISSILIANNDTLKINKGDIIDIPVLVNDFLVGTTTIISVSSATNGIVNIIENGTKLRYTHNDTNTAFDSFTYTISNGISTDTATVSLTIKNIPANTYLIDISSEGAINNNDACFFVLDDIKYFTGDSEGISIGDIVYNESNLSTVFNGNNRWYGLVEGRTVKINNNGLVTDFQLC